MLQERYYINSYLIGTLRDLRQNVHRLDQNLRGQILHDQNLHVHCRCFHRLILAHCSDYIPFSMQNSYCCILSISSHHHDAVHHYLAFRLDYQARQSFLDLYHHHAVARQNLRPHVHLFTNHISVTYQYIEEKLNIITTAA